jgi:hypothetical protein
MKKDEKFRNIIKLFNTKKVISFDIITQQITCSQRTAQRYLKELNSLTSYTHRGKYFTLSTIAQFDMNGFWYFSSIGFSKYGTSIDSILALIQQSENGITKEELENILRIKIPRQIQILLEQKRLYRLKLGNKYLYMSKESIDNRSKKMKILSHRQSEEFHKKTLNITHVIAVLKVVLVEKKIDMSNLKKLIEKYNLDLPIEKMEKLIIHYDLTEKKTR